MASAPMDLAHKQCLNDPDARANLQSVHGKGEGSADESIIENLDQSSEPESSPPPPPHTHTHTKRKIP